jgi:phosphatidylinositol glycan class U
MRAFTLSFLLVVAASISLRLVLQPVTAALSLTSRYELSSPMTSSSRLNEGVYLLSLHEDPYATDLVHFPPWFLFLSRAFLRFSVPSVPSFGLLLLYAFADAVVVVSIGFIHYALRSTPLPILTAVKLCFHPLAILSCLALTSSSTYHAVLFGSLALAAAAHIPMALSLFLLACASSLDFRAATILPVLIAMRCRVETPPQNAKKSAQVLRGIVSSLTFVICYTVLLAADAIILAPSLSHLSNASLFDRIQGGAWSIWRAVPLFDVQVRELVPTVGTAWYMMME